MRAALLVALAAVACGVDPDERDRPAEAGVPPPTEASDSSPELRTFRLLLVNPRPIRALVYADAGAGRVLLDTVPRLDSGRVDIEVRAVRLRLVALDRWGERLGAGSIDLRADSLNRWEIPIGSAAGADTADGGEARPGGSGGQGDG